MLVSLNHHWYEPTGEATAPRDRVDLRVDAVGEAPIERASPTATRDRIHRKSAVVR